MKTLELSIQNNITPVNIAQADGSVIRYELREMSAAGRDQYLEKLSDRMRLDTTGKPCGLKRFAGHQAELLSRCLYLAETNKKISEEEIQLWPANVVNQLFDAAQALHKLNEESAEKAQAEAKNE